MNFDKLTEYLESLKDSHDVKGLDLIVRKNHGTLYRHMQGYNDYSCRRPVSEDDLYYLYSCTKIVTVTACMQLVEQGRIGLQDLLSEYLPEFASVRVADGYEPGDFRNIPDLNAPSHRAERPILIENLLSMTAGLSYDTASEPIAKLREKSGNTAGTVEMMSAIARMPLLYEPGERYAYSLGHDVIAAVIETVSGEKFSNYVMTHIFEPLGVTDIYFHPGPKEKKRLAAQYSIDFATGKKSPKSDNSFCLTKEYDSGGAGLIATVNGFSALLDALACKGMGANGRRILREESIRKIGTPLLSPVQLDDFTVKGMFRPGYSYGLGVRVLADGTKSKSPVGEFGWDGAAGAYALIDPKNNISVFYAQEILGMAGVYSEVPPRIRVLVYECIFDESGLALADQNSDNPGQFWSGVRRNGTVK